MFKSLQDIATHLQVNDRNKMKIIIVKVNLVEGMLFE